MDTSASRRALHDIVGPGLGLGGSTSQGTRVGDWLFLGSQTPHDPASGELVTRIEAVPDELRRRVETGMVIADVPERRIRAQTWRCLRNLQLLLEASGSSLEHLVHLRLFLRDMRDATSAIQVLRAMVRDLPSTSVVGATGEGVDERIDVQVDAVALAADGATERVNLHLPELEALTAPFPAATRAGQLLFTTPVAGVGPRSGALVTRIADLEPDDRALAGEVATPRDESLVAQHLALWRNVRRILDSQGVPFENVLHQNGWLRISMRDFVPVARVRSRLFGSGPGRTAATSFPVSGTRRDDAAFEYSVIAVIPSSAPSTLHPAPWTKQIKAPSHGVGPYYLAAVQAGPFVLTAGEVPINAAVPKHVDTAADLDLDDELRLLQYGRAHRERPIMAQAHYVYRLLFEALEAYGCGPRDVVHQTVYMVDAADFPALERIATLSFGPRLPPTTLVPILGTSPFAEARLEIEFVLVATEEA